MNDKRINDKRLWEVTVVSDSRSAVFIYDNNWPSTRDPSDMPRETETMGSRTNPEATRSFHARRKSDQMIQN